MTPDLEAEGLATVQRDGVTGHKVFLHLHLFSHLLLSCFSLLLLCGLGSMPTVGTEMNLVICAVTLCFLLLYFHEDICWGTTEMYSHLLVCLGGKGLKDSVGGWEGGEGWWSGWRMGRGTNTSVGLHILLPLFMRLLLELNPSNKCRCHGSCKHYTQKSGKVRKNLHFGGRPKSLKKNHI